MNTEYEVKVLDISHEKMKKKLENLGANFEFQRLQRRYVYDVKPVSPLKWIRLRTDGVVSTLTIKNITEKTIDGTKELEIKVDDFDKTYQILKELGYVPRSYQENRRTRYYLDGVEIDLDEWPLIPEYMEIEGKNEEEIKKILEKLQISYENVTTLDVESIYKKYGYEIKNENLKF